jgi:hypothetical protein
VARGVADNMEVDPDNYWCRAADVVFALCSFGSKITSEEGLSFSPFGSSQLGSTAPASRSAEQVSLYLKDQA